MPARSRRARAPLAAAARWSPLRRPVRHEPGTTLVTPDGERLSAMHDPPLPDAADPGLCFVVAHGVTGSWRRPDTARIAAHLHAFGGVVSFDFRGHGGSTGASTVGDLEVLDLATAVRHARALGYARVVTLGWSMGAAVAVLHAAGSHRTPWSGAAAAAARVTDVVDDRVDVVDDRVDVVDDRVDAVVAVSGPGRWRFRGTPPMRRAYRGFETRLGRVVVHAVLGARLTGTAWDPGPEPPDAVAGRVAPTPLLVVHGDADHYFPLDHARWLVRAAGPTATLWVEPGFGHAEAAARPELVRRIAVWALAAAARSDGGDGRGVSARMPA